MLQSSRGGNTLWPGRVSSCREPPPLPRGPDTTLSKQTLTILKAAAEKQQLDCTAAAVTNACAALSSLYANQKQMFRFGCINWVLRLRRTAAQSGLSPWTPTKLCLTILLLFCPAGYCEGFNTWLMRRPILGKDRLQVAGGLPPAPLCPPTPSNTHPPMHTASLVESSRSQQHCGASIIRSLLQ
jgi:hypothetical protein